MTESKNTNVEKDGTVNQKTEIAPTGKKVISKNKTTEVSKSERLDRLETQLKLIENGLLVLLNEVNWQNQTIDSNVHHRGSQN